MGKYILFKCTSCQIAGKVYKKSDKVVFDTDDPKFAKVKGEIEAAAKAGYLEDVSKGNNDERRAKAAIKAEAETAKKDSYKQDPEIKEVKKG